MASVRGRGWAFGVCVLLAGVWLLACSKGPEHKEIRQAPDFSLPTVDGQTIRLSELRGKVVLLDFWATWCPPCRVAIPHLVEIQRRYRKDGLVVIGMNLDQDPDELMGFMRRTEFNYPVVMVDEATRKAFGGIPTIPQVFLIDRKGRIRKKYLGYSREIAENMDRMIQHLLQEPAEASGEP